MKNMTKIQLLSKKDLNFPKTMKLHNLTNQDMMMSRQDEMECM